MIKPWILNMNMTKSLKPQKTISNLITRFMFTSGLCEYTPSQRRFNHRWFRGSSIHYIQTTQITWSTWRWNFIFFIFLDCRENSEHPFDLGISFESRIFTKLLFEIRVEAIFEKKWFRLSISIFHIFRFQSSFQHRWLEFERIFGHLYMCERIYGDFLNRNLWLIWKSCKNWPTAIHAEANPMIKLKIVNLIFDLSGLLSLEWNISASKRSFIHLQ